MSTLFAILVWRCENAVENYCGCSNGSDEKQVSYHGFCFDFVFDLDSEPGPVGLLKV